MASKRNNASRMIWTHSIARAVVIGVVLVALAFGVSVYMQTKSLTSLAGDVESTLRQQCASYDKLVVSDRTKSLFRLADEMKELSEDLGAKGEPVTDGYLKKRVGELRISGIAVLDRHMHLEASAYTRAFGNSDWVGPSLSSSIEGIVDHPSKVFAERISVGDDYYDVCAVARNDKKGLVIGFYKQPTGLVANMESDLANLLTGLRLEREGEYAIVEDGTLRAASDASLDDDTQGSGLLAAFDSVQNDDGLHSVSSDQGTYWVHRGACGSYDLYVYYPMSSLISGALLMTGAASVLYLLLSLAYFAIRGQVIYQNQEKLERSNKELSETVEMLKSLETVFFTLFRIDLENNRYETIYLAPWLEDKIKHQGVYGDLRKLFLDTMVVPEHRDMIDEAMSNDAIREKLGKQVLSEVRRSFYVDYQAIRGDQRRWCRMTATVVDYGENDYPSHVLVLLQDVDEEKTKETAYQSRILEESRAAKLANDAKSEFLRRISHDIRTPVNGIRGYIDMAGRHPEDMELQERCRSNELVALDALMSLVNSVLDMVKLEGREINLVEAPFDLNELLDEVSTVLQPQAKAQGVACSVEHGSDELCRHLVGSRRHISQVFMNLMGNAIKYGKQGGYVRLSAHLVERDDEGALYEFVCEDDGIGMSEEFQKRMFEPFAQENAGARTVYGGSGLGLSIVEKLVEAMGGTVDVNSVKGEGTTFTVRLRFGIDKEAHREVKSSKSYADALKDKSVLLVEDNELNMEIAAFLLEDCGAKVAKAWNGKEALDAIAASSPGDYDLIITDVLMPVMDGLEEARQIRALKRDDAKRIPVVAVSANAFSDDVSAGYEAGVDAYIAKPIETERLLRVVGKLLEERG